MKKQVKRIKGIFSGFFFNRTVQIYKCTLYLSYYKAASCCRDGSGVKALGAPAEDMSLVPNTNIRQLTTACFRGSDTIGPSEHLRKQGTHKIM